MEENMQDADYIYREEVDAAVEEYRKEHGEAPEWMPNQYFAALTNMRSVGVMGDERTYVRLRGCTARGQYGRFHDSGSCQYTVRGVTESYEQDYQ